MIKWSYDSEDDKYKAYQILLLRAFVKLRVIGFALLTFIKHAGENGVFWIIDIFYSIEIISDRNLCNC